MCCSVKPCWWACLQEQNTQEQIIAALLKKDPSLLKVCKPTSDRLLISTVSLPCTSATAFQTCAVWLQEVNSNGKSAADLVSHKKRLREWFQVQTHTHLTAECRLHIISGKQLLQNGEICTECAVRCWLWCYADNNLVCDCRPSAAEE